MDELYEAMMKRIHPYPKAAFRGSGPAAPEVQDALQHRDDTMRRVGNVMDDPLDAIKAFFHLQPFDAVMHKPMSAKGSMMPMLPSLDKGVDTEFGPQVLQENIKKYFMNGGR